MTIREALAEGNAALKKAGVESPGLDSSLLLAEVLHTSRASLIAAGPDPLPEEAIAVFRGLVRRRGSGECAAYILGRKEFRGLDFAVNPAVLVPRPDTETLVEAAIENLKSLIAANGIANGAAAGAAAPGAADSAARILDLCTGSGAVAIALKHEMPELEVWAADISPEALETAKTNARRLLPGASIRFLRGNLFEALEPGVSFPLIVSNPPYIPSSQIKTLSREAQNEPRLALDGGGDGLAIISGIIAGAPDFLAPGGVLLMEADPGQMRETAALLAEKGFITIKTYKDLSDRERVIGGTKPREIA